MRAALSGDGAPVHQALHGYDNGHRLLASSRRVDDDDLWLIDRLSDASGQRPAPDNDGYLTGYPLPSGTAYALARTWYMPSPPRPNIVWTHTLLVPLAMLEAERMDALLQLLTGPTDEAADGRWEAYRAPLDVTGGTKARPRRADRAAARQVLDALYGRGDGPVSLEVNGLRKRDELCVAVWEQQWPRLRGHFSFCSGALEPRRTTHGPFDLMLMPPQHGPAAPPQEPGAGELTEQALGALEGDLGHPGPLREFLRRCGPDSARRRVMPLLIDAFVTAKQGGPPGSAIGTVTARAPKASSMRHLKRALLDPHDGLLRDAPPDEVLQALLRPDVSERLLAADAALGRWAALAWDHEPAAVMELLRPAEADHGVAGPAADAQPTVARAARDEVSTVVAAKAGLRHLANLTARDAALAARLVAERNSGSWWAEWAGLPEPAFVATVVTGRFDPPPLLARAVAAVAATDRGEDRWRALRDRAGAPAVVALLSTPRLSGALGVTLAERPDLLAEALGTGLGAEQAAAAADAAPDLAFVRSTGFAAWRPLAEVTDLWKREPRRAAVVLAAALAAPPGLADPSAARAYDRLYRAFLGDGARDAWDLLAPALPGKPDDWDRCRRLAQWLADAVLGRHGAPRPGVLSAVPTGSARDRLQDELERRARRAKDDADGGRRGQGGWDEIVRFLRPW